MADEPKNTRRQKSFKAYTAINDYIESADALPSNHPLRRITREFEEAARRPFLDELETQIAAAQPIQPTEPTASPDEAIVARWPWQVDPTLIEHGRGGEAQKVRNGLEKHFRPEEILGLSISKIVTELKGKGISASDGTVRRVLGREKR